MPSQTIKCPTCAFEASTSAPTCPFCGKAYPENLLAGGAGMAKTPTTGPEVIARLTARVKKATVERFDILRLLGRGGMAAVYQAYDKKLDRNVALKVMLPQLEWQEEMIERFSREVKTAARLDHDCIMRVYDVMDAGGADDHVVLLVMNMIDGASLEQVVQLIQPTSGLEPKQFPVAVAQSVLIQVAGALEYAHHQRVIHRDIKPSNVMISTKGVAIITDFGIAKISGATTVTNPSTLIMGTPTYMSPEQSNGQVVSGASDQYSLGIMAYELLVGEPPFVGTLHDVQTAHRDLEPPLVTRRRPDVHPKIAAAIARALAKRPGDRFPSMAAFAHAVGEGYDPTGAQPKQMLGAAAATAVTMRTQFGSGDLLAIPQRPTKIIVEAPDTVVVGQSFTIMTTVKDANGLDVRGVSINLISKNPEVAAINALGAVAVGPGTAHIVATGGGVWGEASVHVIPKSASSSPDGPDTTQPGDDDMPPHIASLRIVPPPARVTAGRSFKLVAAAFTDRGTQVPNAKMRWNSENSGIARIDETGTGRALKPGTARFSCECGGIVATTQIEVVTKEPLEPSPTPGPDEDLEYEATGPMPGPDKLIKPEPWRLPPRPKRSKLPWVVALIAIVGGILWVKWGPGRTRATQTAAVEPFLGETIRTAILSAGYSMAEPHVTEDFTSPGSYWTGMATSGRVTPPGETGVVRRETGWTVQGADFVAHFEIRAEVSRAADGSGFFFGADAGADVPTNYYLLLFKAGRTPSYRLTQVSGKESREVIRSEETGNTLPGNDKVDVIVVGGAMSIYINERLLKTVSPLRFPLDGRFGLYVSPGELYSFDNVAVAALRPI